MLVVIDRYFEFGPFRLDAAERVLLCHGDLIPLTPKAFETLLILVRHHGRDLSKDDLIQWIWPDAVVEEATLSQNVFTIRNALRSGSSEPLIETVPKIGYRFVAPVRAITESRPVSLAVLPFTPIQSGARDESLELGLADAIITRLSTANRFILRPTSAIRRFSNLRQDSMSAARELRVELVLEGSVHRIDESVRACDGREGPSIRRPFEPLLVPVGSSRALLANRSHRSWCSARLASPCPSLAW